MKRIEVAGIMSYVTAVADLFLARSLDVKILKPEDYVIIAEWEKQQIPLFIVLDSIDDGLAKNPHLQIESIAFFQDEVKKQFADWLQK
jgi:hypothetical protein